VLCRNGQDMRMSRPGGRQGGRTGDFPGCGPRRQNRLYELRRGVGVPPCRVNVQQFERLSADSPIVISVLGRGCGLLGRGSS